MALVKLPTAFRQTEHVSPIALNNCVTNKKLISHELTISGWGKTENGLLPNLKKGVHRIVKTDAVFKGHKVDDTYHLQGEQSQGVGVCIGDSGSKSLKENNHINIYNILFILSLTIDYPVQLDNITYAIVK